MTIFIVKTPDETSVLDILARRYDFLKQSKATGVVKLDQWHFPSPLLGLPGAFGMSEAERVDGIIATEKESCVEIQWREEGYVVRCCNIKRLADTVLEKHIIISHWAF